MADDTDNPDCSTGKPGTDSLDSPELLDAAADWRNRSSMIQLKDNRCTAWAWASERNTGLSDRANKDFAPAERAVEAGLKTGQPAESCYWEPDLKKSLAEVVLMAAPGLRNKDITSTTQLEKNFYFLPAVA